MKKFKTFLSDGMDTREYLLLVFSILFIFLIVTTTIYALLGKEISSLLDIIKSMDMVVITIVSGTMGVQAVSMIANSKKQKFNYDDKSVNYQNEVLTYEEEITQKPIQEDFYNEDSYQGRI